MINVPLSAYGKPYTPPPGKVDASFDLEVMAYKLVALKLMTVPTDLRFQLPDLRLALGTVLLVVFLAVGWIRSARRS